MSSSSRFRSIGNIAAAAGGTTIYNLSQWFLLIAVARLADPQSVGLYSYALAVTAPLALLFGLNLRQSYITEDLSTPSFAAYFRLRASTSIVLIIVYLTIGSILTANSMVIVAVGLAKTIDLLADFTMAPLQKSGNLVGIGVAQTVNGLTTFSCVFVSLLIGVQPEVALATTVIGSLAAATYSYFLLRKLYPALAKVMRPRWWLNKPASSDRFTLKRLLIALLPLGLAAGYASARVTFPRYVLEATWGLTEIGIYSAALHITVAANALVGAVAQLALPRLVATFRSSGAPALRRPVVFATGAWLLFGVLGTLVALYFGPQVLTLIYGSEYAAEGLMWVLAIAWGLSSGATMVELGIIAQRRFGSQSHLNLMALVLTALASFFIIPTHGMIGAAWAGVISASALLIGNSAYFIWITRRLTRTM